MVDLFHKTIERFCNLATSLVPAPSTAVLLFLCEDKKQLFCVQVLFYLAGVKAPCPFFRFIRRA